MRKELITQKNPKSPVAEIFRALRTNVQFMNTKRGLKSILITSTVPNEGKTFVSSNLAITFAQAGKKVVLIDGDMRKGKLSYLFSTESVPGLSNYLSGVDSLGAISKVDITKCIKETEVNNLYLIPVGNTPPNPAELLTSELTEKMLNQLEEMFDIIIIDGTPGLLVTDAIILSRLVDTTILVASHKSTKKDNLKKVQKSIENVGGKIAGVVLNKMPLDEEEYKSSYYYSSGDVTVHRTRK